MQQLLLEELEMIRKLDELAAELTGCVVYLRKAPEATCQLG